jgi:hypothetical protein
MKETTWTPSSIAIGERADKTLALVLADPIELTSIPLHRRDAHRLGTELVKAAALTPEEITNLEQQLDETRLQ